ncbi:hypothetical protein JCM8097_008921 [Rhodosporidiobolus ruineniae]
MASFSDLSPELVTVILAHTLDGTAHQATRQLRRLSKVNRDFAAIARRLHFRSIVIDSPHRGAKLLETLRNEPSVATHIRSIVIKPEAFEDKSLFSDRAQDDLLRLATSAQSPDSPYASFAPSEDGRKTLPAYPATLQACRLGDILRSEEYGQIPDDPSFAPHHAQALPPPRRSSPSTRAYDASPFSKLTALLLDFSTITPYFLTWLATSTVNLEKLQLWCVSGIGRGDIVALVQRVGGELKELMFKPKGSKQNFVANEMVSQLPKLERLTLGDKAADHTLYSSLPSTITHLCVALPNNHQNARLAPIADEIRTRLTSLIRLELYSHLYFPPPAEIVYPPRSENASNSLREVRLSHLNIAPGELEAFLEVVGPELYVFGHHHALDNPTMPFLHLPSLRRLELGVFDFVADAYSEMYLDTLYCPFLHTLRVHFASALPLPHLLKHFPSLLRNGLKTLELVGIFPGDLVVHDKSCWTSGALMDQLVDETKAGGFELVVNGRPVESMGDLWRALLGQTGREAL